MNYVILMGKIITLTYGNLLSNEWLLIALPSEKEDIKNDELYYY